MSALDKQNLAQTMLDTQSLFSDKADKTAVDLKEDKANKGATNGYAPLVGGVIPAAYVPNAYDDFIEVATYADLPVTGQTGVSYTVVADETSGGNTSNYRWTGSVTQRLVKFYQQANLKRFMKVTQTLMLTQMMRKHTLQACQVMCIVKPK
jgi:hypothetical protein